MATRTDCHRPGAIVPADYAPIVYYSAPSYGLPCGINWRPEGPCSVHEECREDPEMASECRSSGFVPTSYATHYADLIRIGGLTNCSVCGAAFKYGTVYRHVPTGEYISMGHDCSEKYEMAADDATWTAQADMRARAALAHKTEAMRKNAWESLQRSEPELAAAFSYSYPDRSFAARVVPDILDRGRQYGFGKLSDKQKALVLKLHREVTQPKAPEPSFPVAEVPEGRVTLDARLVHWRNQESDFGTVVKALFVVATEEGDWKLWTTLPKGSPSVKGSILRITATVKRKEPGFGVGSRPKFIRDLTPMADDGIAEKIRGTIKYPELEARYNP